MPDAVSPEIAETLRIWKKVRAEFQSMGIPTEAELDLWQPGQGNRQVGSAEEL